mmetsp:Transcript_10216/g.31204  ORF Transcript_10216/g.31204 Transcript_10216/m.31204 type:complete len:93 (+) Transcript_10216:545-823(+)
MDRPPLQDWDAQLGTGVCATTERMSSDGDYEYEEDLQATRRSVEYQSEDAEGVRRRSLALEGNRAVQKTPQKTGEKTKKKSLMKKLFKKSSS